MTGKRTPITTEHVSVFARTNTWKHRYSVTLYIGEPGLCAGVPASPKVVEGWLKSKFMGSESAMHEMLVKTMIELGYTAEDAAGVEDISVAASALAVQKGLEVFKSDEHGIFIEGRQLKAAIREATNSAVGAGLIKQQGWGETRKWALGFVNEHIMVAEHKLYIMRDGKNVTQAEVVERPVHTHNGDSISRFENVTGVEITATVETDWDFEDKYWATMWEKAEYLGIGAKRSQDYGRFLVTGWKKLPTRKS